MTGAIAGDIAGSRFEFDNTDRYDFELFTGQCDYTDDTICTVAVADAILHGRSYLEAVHSWCRKYPNPMGAYGTSFMNWIYSDNPQPYGSYGNGAAMRVSPVAWAFDTAEEVARQAEATAAISHNHPEGIKGAVVTALLIFNLRKGNLRACHAIIEEHYGKEWERHLPRPGYFDVTCQGCVPLCWKMLNESNGFEDALRLTISYGGDTDTTGAIVGSLAEALYGVPDAIKVAAISFLPEEMKRVVSEFEHRFKSPFDKEC